MDDNGNKMNEKFALVTGASSGMGFDYSRILAGMGYSLIMVALVEEETLAAANKIKEEFSSITVYGFGQDLSVQSAPKEVFDKVMEYTKGDGVEVLINNAGVLYPKHFHNMTQAQVSNIVMIHNYSSSMLCHYFLPKMRERKLGYILNVSSMAAWLPYPFISTYASTKAFVRVFTKSLRCELKGSGVNVSSVCFGAVSTGLIGLPPHLNKLAINLGVMIRSEKAAKKALKMLFKGRSEWVPGLFNKISLPLARILPVCLLAYINKIVTKKWNLK